MIKLNNKGQTLIMFVLLIPLILLIMALVIDTSFVYKEKIKFQSITKTILRNTYDKRYESNFEEYVSNLYQKNKINTDNLKIKVNENDIIVKNDYKINSIFGRIIGVKNYKIKLSFKVYKENNNIKLIKE